MRWMWIHLVSCLLIAANDVRSGPMLGNVELTQVQLWLQTHDPVDLQIRFWPKDESARSRLSRVIATNQDGDLIATFTLTDLLPSTRYEYELYLNGVRQEFDYPLEFWTQDFWQWRHPPKPFTVAIGSCLYVNDPPHDRPGEPYGKGTGVLEIIHQHHPDLMLWMGDNVYYREPDFYSTPGLVRRNALARQLRHLQPLLASSAHYAIWDDHDYGPNNSDRSYRLKSESLEVFKRFWLNPSYGTADHPGAFTSFSYHGVDFFLMDNRTYRAPNDLRDPDRDYYGEAQFQWLIDGLVGSEAPFKIVVTGNQVLNEYSQHEGMNHYSGEQSRLLKALSHNQIEGVVIVSGDRHFTELLKVERIEPLYPLYEFTSSPLSSGVYDSMTTELENPLRVKGTLVNDTHNFGKLSFRFDPEPVLEMSTVDRQGKLRWSRTIKASELKIGKQATD